MAQWNCDGWQAVHDHTPGKPQTLTVSGTCHTATAGYEFTLAPKDGAQGTNAKDLLLALDVRAPHFASEVPTDFTVEYVDLTDFEYDTVTILDVAAGIPVEHVH